MFWSSKYRNYIYEWYFRSQSCQTLFFTWFSYFLLLSLSICHNKWKQLLLHKPCLIASNGQINELKEVWQEWLQNCIFGKKYVRFELSYHRRNVMQHDLQKNLLDQSVLILGWQRYSREAKKSKFFFNQKKGHQKPIL